MPVEGQQRDGGEPATASLGCDWFMSTMKVEKKLAAVLGARSATYDRDTDRLYDTVKAALHAPD